MKKRSSKIEDLILIVQQQLTFLDKKIDALIGQPRFGQPHRPQETRQDNNYRDRVLHKAICADCNKECEVPFRPSQDRPVYCKDCFSKRKRGGSFREKPYARPRESGPGGMRHGESGFGEVRHGDKRQAGEKKKFFSGLKKKAAGKRRKSRG